VMAYGIGPSLPARMESWREHGYRVEVMTGVAWGSYQDYLDGRYDGKNHWDEAQTTSDGAPILHGGNKEIPYIAPGIDYGRYLTTGIQHALDAGAQAIYLEEPEFWARAGWSPSFKREWKAFYGEEWQAPDSSPDAQYRASKLKYFLYRRALSQVFDFVQQYGAEHGRTIPCYVPTHSLINYAHWRIVSPESSLLRVGASGYIAQVWTGTARTPNIYQGRRRERTFETAFLEYGVMQNLVRGSGRLLWFLNDPVEDDPNHSWSDYRRNWEDTLTASLLAPSVARYEIMPWPERVFNGRYPVRDLPASKSVAEQEQAPIGTGLGGFGHAAAVERAGISPAYETELQMVVHALGEMRQPASAVKWLAAGTRGVGILVSDTMMFERADPAASDANLGSFYGLALPLLKCGIPIDPVQIERASEPGFLDRYRLLLLTYEGQKPPNPAFHHALAEWVKDGGALVVVDDDRDPYNKVREWWNEAPLHYSTPRQDLFNVLGVAANATGLLHAGEGVVVREAVSPAALSYRADGADMVRQLVRRAARAAKITWSEGNALVLRRGPFVIAAGLEESAANKKTFVLRGNYLNLFDSTAPVMHDVKIVPGTRLLLRTVETGKSEPAVVAAACRIRKIERDGARLRFEASGVAGTNAMVVMESAARPLDVLVDGRALENGQARFADGVLRVTFPNTVDGHSVEIRWLD
jgi:hypothetical protein